MSLVWHGGEQIGIPWLAHFSISWSFPSLIFEHCLSLSPSLLPSLSLSHHSLSLCYSYSLCLATSLELKLLSDCITLQYLLTVGAPVIQNAVGWVGLYWITCGKECVLDFSLTASTYVKPGMLRFAVSGWLECWLIPDASTSYWSSGFIYLNHTHPHRRACTHACTLPGPG